MPQFDFANVFIPQLFWLSVFFVILYFGIVKTTLPRLSKVMTAREDTIKTDLADARAAKEDADRLEDEYRMRIDAGREEARKTIAAAKAQAGEAAEKRLSAADDTVSARTAEAETRIAAARAEAEGSLREIAADSARMIVGKLTGSEPSPAAVEAAVNGVMTQENRA